MLEQKEYKIQIIESNGFFEIESNPDKYMISIFGYPKTKITTRCNYKGNTFENVRYTYPTRNVYDEDGNLLAENFSDTLYFWIDKKAYGNKIMVSDSISEKNYITYKQHIGRRIKTCLKAIFTDYDNDKINYLSKSVESYIVNLQYH